jgi:hypothetical protein
MSKYNRKWMVTANQTEKIISTHQLKQSIKLNENFNKLKKKKKTLNIHITKKECIFKLAYNPNNPME